MLKISVSDVDNLIGSLELSEMAAAVIAEQLRRGLRFTFSGSVTYKDGKWQLAEAFILPIPAEKKG